MTPTPDIALAARLAELENQLLLAQAGGSVGGWGLQRSALNDALCSAYRSDQLITLADHTEAVQAAVAKAVEATLNAAHEYTDQTYSMQFLSHPVDRERIAAILARK